MIIAGIINLFTAALHLTGGQMSLINPLLSSNIDIQIKTELLGVWHMVTLIMFATSFLLLYFGFKQQKNQTKELVSFIGYLYVLFSLSFIGVNIANGVFAPQWTLLLPIGILSLIGVKKMKKNVK